MRRYASEEIPRPDADLADGLARLSPSTGTTTTGTGALDIPIPSAPYHRAPLGTLVETDVQDLAIGAEVPQAGAGRPFVRPALTFGEQSVTPQPDGRRIARPMPSTARDEAEVIR